MNPIHQFYLQHMASSYGYRATWEPNKPLSIGTIIKLEKGVFSVYSSLKKEGIAMEIMEDSSEGVLDYSSNGAVKIGTKLAGEVPLAGSVLTKTDAGFNITFDTDKAIVFQADKTTTTQITNLAAIEKEIIQKERNGQWQKDWLIVTELMSASTATIIISYSNDTNIDLKVNTNVGTPTLKLTDASLGLTVAGERGEHIKVLAQNGITPLYRAMGLVHPLFGKRELQTKDPAAPEPQKPVGKFQIQPFDPAELNE